MAIAGQKDFLELKAEQGRKKAEAFIKALRTIQESERSTKTAMGFSELRVTIDLWCAGLKDEFGNDVAMTLKGFLDRVEDEGMDASRLVTSWRYFERALVASVPMALEKEEADVRRGFEIRWSEYLEERRRERVAASAAAQVRPA
jgi:hypothetical protein